MPSAAALAQTDAINGMCTQGGVSAVVQGLNSTNKLQGVIPACQVTVFLTGSTIKATIFKDPSGTPLSNPFTASTPGAAAPGQWLFYAADSVGYDVVMSGGIPPLTFTQPVTLTDLKVGTGGGGGSTVILPGQNITCTPFSGGQCVGNVTINALNTVQIQHNGTNVTDQLKLNFGDSIPAAPAGFMNVPFLADGIGGVSAYVPLATSGLQTQVIPPVAGQYIVIYPTAAVGGCTHGTSCTASSGAFGANSWAAVGAGPHNTINGVGAAFEFGGYALPAGFTGTVTSVYGFTSQSLFGPLDVIDMSCTWTGGTGSTGIGNPAVLFGSLTGANIPSTLCVAEYSSSIFTDVPAGATTSPMALIVYYTGSAFAQTAGVSIQYPLQYIDNTLSIFPYAPFPSLYDQPYTVAQLSAFTYIPPTGATFNVVDALTAGQCTTGGGIFQQFCQFNGSTYVPVGGGGGGSTAWSSLTNPTTNLSLSMGANTSTFTYGSASGTTSWMQWLNSSGVGWGVLANGSLAGIGSSSSHGMTVPEGTALSGVATSDVLTTSSSLHRFIQNPNNIGPLIIPGIASAGTAGDCVELAASGIDLADTGSPCGSGGGAVASVSSGINTTVSPTTGAVIVNTTGGSGSLALFPAESYGAVGDWNGTTGTDNTTALQNAINAAQTAGGGCVSLAAKAYKITGALSITVNGVGICGSQIGETYNPSALPASIIITTSATADVIQVSAAYGTFTNVGFFRSVPPTGGTTNGMKLVGFGEGLIDHVAVQDSNNCFHFTDGSGAAGIGVLQNSNCLIGYSVTETSGTYVGFNIDSTDDNPNPSMRLRYTGFFVNPALSGTTSYGLYAHGTNIEDIITDNLEMGGAVNYCVAIVDTGSSTTYADSDIHIRNTICDQPVTTGFYVSGLTSGTTAGNVEFAGGSIQSFVSGSKAFDFESSSGITMSHVSIGGSQTTTGLVHLSSNVALVGNLFFNVPGTAISGVGMTASSITGNTFLCASGTTAIALTSTSANNAITGNSMNGTCTNGLSFDSTSANNTALSTNSYGSSITNQVINAGASNPVIIPPTNSGTGVNGLAGDAGANFGADFLDLYHSGTDKYGWGLNSGEMQFFLGAVTDGAHFSINNGPGGLQPSGTGERLRYLLGTPTVTGFFTLPSNALYTWSSTTSSSGSVDTGLSRDSAGAVDIGNGTAADKSGKINAAIVNAGTGYQLGGAAPSGHCLIGNGTNYIDSASCGSSGVTSVGLSVPASSIFGVSGSPVTSSGTLGLTTTGTSGGIPYFSSTSALSSSALLTSNVLIKGGGAGTAPSNSLATDNGTTLAYTGTGGDVAVSYTSNGTTAGFIDYAAGSTSAAVAPCNTSASWCVQAPASLSSNFIETLPTPSTGVILHTLSGSTITDTIIIPYVKPVVAAISSATGGSGTGTVTCLTAACTNISGTYSVVGGTFTTGTFLTLVWPTTTTAYSCWTSQNGGVATYGMGHGVATATGMTITAGISIISATVTVDYGCSAL